MNARNLNTLKWGSSAGHIQLCTGRDSPPEGVYVPLTPGYHGRDLDTNLGWTRFNPTGEMIDMLQPWIGHLWGEP